MIFRVVLPDGGIRFIQAGAQVERDADGNPLQVTGINIDITSDQQLQARLREPRSRRTPPARRSRRSWRT